MDAISAISGAMPVLKGNEETSVKEEAKDLVEGALFGAADAEEGEKLVEGALTGAAGPAKDLADAAKENDKDKSFFEKVWDFLGAAFGFGVTSAARDLGDAARANESK